MIDGRAVVAVVAARGGSKGFPGKNLAPLGGLPLIQWTLRAASDSGIVDRTIVSSDDAAIIAEARRLGAEVPFVRPDVLAIDESPIVDAVLHAVDAVDMDDGYVVLLQPTSPLRTGADIDGAVRRCHEAGAPACVSVTAPAKPPAWLITMDDSGRLEPLLDCGAIATRRQETPPAWMPNGAVYVADVNWLRETRRFYAEETVGFVMPRERSVDIDEPVDLVVAEALISGATVRRPNQAEEQQPWPMS